MGYNTVTDTDTEGTKTIQLIKDTPDGVVRYFDQEKFGSNSNLDLRVKLSFPNQSPLDYHNMFINIEQMDFFLDRDAIHTEHIDDLSYDEFECYICMSGLEQELYTHDKTRPIHFHKECYHELADQIESFIKDNIIAIQSEGDKRTID